MRTFVRWYWFFVLGFTIGDVLNALPTGSWIQVPEHLCIFLVAFWLIALVHELTSDRRRRRTR